MKKKLFSLLLIAVMVLSSFSAVFADGETTTITIDANGSSATMSDHTFKAYQIFTGQMGDDKTLGNVEWASGINSSAFLTALKNDATIGSKFAACTDAASVAKVIAENLNTAELEKVAQIATRNVAGNGITLVNGANELTLADGYYVVVDATANVGENGVYNPGVLVKSGDAVTIKVKTDKPSSDKGVKDKNDSTDDDYTAYQDSADHDIGDKVPYQIVATVPAGTGAAKYQAPYIITFKDTMSKGLTYDGNAANAYTVKVLKNGTEVANSGLTVTYANPTPNPALTGEYEGGSYHTWTTSDLRTVITDDTAEYKIVIEYEATLNTDAKIGAAGNPNKFNIDYTNKPDHVGDGAPTGETPEDTCIVFTYKVVVDKVDESDKPLPNAGFTLYKKAKDGSWNEVEKIDASANTSFTFKGLDDGEYKLSETATPAGYNTMEDITFTITASHPGLVLPELNGAQSGLADGAAAALTFTRDTNDEDSLDTKVVNRKGSVLPETGGMGTTIIYILGAALVVGAGVVLVSRKKVNDR
ncbi:MAG: isopeptide-forming domain-containing fimbrial protein [Firmicutes bacterium]|nr:isopeptide-forming domain-containing fimbrial protein [Bacillota bacterium]